MSEQAELNVFAFPSAATASGDKQSKKSRVLMSAFVAEHLVEEKKREVALTSPFVRSAPEPEKEVVAEQIQETDAEPESSQVDESDPEDSDSKESADVEEPLPQDEVSEESESSDGSVEETASKQATVDQEWLQQQLDEAFQRGLQQGRQEGSSQLENVIRQQACDEGHAAGVEEGVRQGVEKGISEAQDELKRRYDLLDDLAQKAQALQDLSGVARVRDLVALLERLVQEVVRVELKHSPEQIAEVVKQALTILDRGEQETLTARVHPDDLIWLQEMAESGEYALKFLPDESVTLGGCRIEGRLGEVDATLESRLEAGINQLRSLLLDEPELAPPVDLTAVKNNRRLISEPVYEQEFSTYSSAQKSASQSHPVTKPGYAESAESVFNPKSEEVGGLGAWAALGQ